MSKYTASCSEQQSSVYSISIDLDAENIDEVRQELSKIVKQGYCNETSADVDLGDGRTMQAVNRWGKAVISYRQHVNWDTAFGPRDA